MAKFKQLEVSLGITMEVNGTYIKPNATVTIELDDIDNTKEKRDKIWQAAWKQVDDQVTAKIQELKGE